MVNLRHIQMIRAIVQEGTVTAASKKLFISQPALSQVIKNVEDEIGASLFEKNGSRLKLTYAGELFIEYGQQMLDIDRELHMRIADLKDDVYGELRLGISVQRGLQILPELISAFTKEYPHVKIRLCEEGSAKLEVMIAEGECDVAFITTTSKRNNIHYELIENEHLVLVASKNTELARRFEDGATLDITEARGEKFISMATDHSVRAIQDQLFRENGLRPEIILETHNMEAAKSITALSDAVFLVPDVYVDDEMKNRDKVNVYYIKNNNYARHFYFCYRDGMYFTQYHRFLLKAVYQQLNVPYMEEL